jgi:hypothetical protein
MPLSYVLNVNCNIRRRFATGYFSDPGKSSPPQDGCNAFVIWGGFFYFSALIFIALFCWWYRWATNKHGTQKTNSQPTKTNEVALNDIAHHINIELAHSATELPSAVVPQDSASGNVANDQQPASNTAAESDAMAARV